ncbi:DUF6119 family protein [Membranihabitans maritimus]|uniref:DUF6119 family protein n=1 Tax=Membranihabitans maritimus TaxID=2904244 RepID=UPI001F2FA106|nr:DUF6119 family protein [Membranihabitans maritimus]
MPKFNIYKIDVNKKDDLVEKLESVNLTKTGEKVLDGYSLEFYFSKTPDEVEVWWTEIYSEFINQEEVPKNSIYFGTMLVYNNQVCYAISLGKSHFYLKKFSDTDFGLNLGERIVDEENLKIKNSKFFKSKKSKTITSYQSNTPVTYDSGESLHYIKAKTISMDEWGKVASFGTSAQLNLDILPDELPNLINRIEIKLFEDPIIKLPKTELIKDEEVEEMLDARLGIALEAKENPAIQIDEFSVSGVDFIFSERSSYKFYIQGDSRNKTNLLDLTVDNLMNFVRDRGINLRNEINTIKVYVHNEHGRGHSEMVKAFLDYVDNDRYCLIDGKWHRFNESYLQYLNDEVQKIPWTYSPELDISLSVSEDDFNDCMEEDHGYRNIHRDSSPLDNPLGRRFQVEKMDLYKDRLLFFVKIGKPQKLGYAIDQALNTVRLLQHNSSNILIDGEEQKVQGICLWLIIDKRVNNISALSDINSIIFLMKLVDWRKAVLDAGYSPLIKINYRRDI